MISRPCTQLGRRRRRANRLAQAPHAPQPLRVNRRPLGRPRPRWRRGRSRGLSHGPPRRRPGAQADRASRRRRLRGSRGACLRARACCCCAAAGSAALRRGAAARRLLRGSPLGAAQRVALGVQPLRRGAGPLPRGAARLRRLRLRLRLRRRRRLQLHRWLRRRLHRPPRRRRPRRAGPARRRAPPRPPPLRLGGGRLGLRRGAPREQRPHQPLGVARRAPRTAPHLARRLERLRRHLCRAPQRRAGCIAQRSESRLRRWRTAPPARTAEAAAPATTGARSGGGAPVAAGGLSLARPRPRSASSRDCRSMNRNAMRARHDR